MKNDNNQFPDNQNLALEHEREMLLSLANDIISVKDRNDLIQTFSKHMRELFYFSHAIVTLIDPKDETYSPILLDQGSATFGGHPEYEPMVKARFTINEPFAKTVLLSAGPCAFTIADVMASPQSPAYLRLNYELGIRKVLMAVLRLEDKPIAFLHIHSDREDSFTPQFIDVTNRITPHLSSAVANIIKNDEIVKKENEKSFLLDFSNEITAVRTKEELGTVVNEAILKLTPDGSYVIRKINPNTQTLSAYLWNQGSLTSKHDLIKEVLDQEFPINDGLQNRVLESYIPLLISVERELLRGIKAPYLDLWKSLGFSTMVGIALRNNNANIGLLWLSINEINIQILKGLCSQIAISMGNIMANDELVLANKQILSYKNQLEEENHYLKQEMQSLYSFTEVVGESQKMQEVYKLMSLVSNTNSTVLILGETGTGKELIAREIHNASAYKNKLMIKVNCAAIPSNLIESELFGHEKGAFTGASERRIGKFELANNSTIFLDEIGEMPLEAQVKLLRVLQEKEMERVGGTGTIKLNVRVIAATNRNLENEVKEGRFRSDLYYRLNVFPIILPALRDRVEDIESLCTSFLKRYSKNTGRKPVKISHKAIQQLQSYLWPGNVRELEHFIERSILLATDQLIREVHLPIASQSSTVANILTFDQSLEEMERSYIVEILKRCQGKISGVGGAAEILKVPGNTLHSKIKKLNISKAEYFTN
ncbi:sigma-54 dependent transcriptional regulator [Dyadobacter sp. LJ53]|uniref:sigma-54-dependent Fis family transcriptional regulator n=1 Tax=Dyadobacter chenwenxiniae TaxID=2906456 RepID=UPI001F181ADC|nr:sigma-54 dependent transcriptional regulator [Dyadobacter chenwenxiniae]MCF0049304.1 sigma-54 dependent transcriptional regulator [Dyadobacter chenwenxiniae]